MIRPRQATAQQWHQRRILALIMEHEEISFDDMAIQLEIDRSTAVLAVKSLVYAGRLQKQPGRGRRPNRYICMPESALC